MSCAKTAELIDSPFGFSDSGEVNRVHQEAPMCSHGRGKGIFRGNGMFRHPDVNWCKTVEPIEMPFGL